MVPSTGVEPVACCLGGSRSIHLSYEGVKARSIASHACLRTPADSPAKPIIHR